MSRPRELELELEREAAQELPLAEASRRLHEAARLARKAERETPGATGTGVPEERASGPVLDADEARLETLRREDARPVAKPRNPEMPHASVATSDEPTELTATMSETLPRIEAVQDAYMRQKSGADRIKQAKRDLAPHVKQSREVLAEYTRLYKLYYEDLAKLSTVNLRALYLARIPPHILNRFELEVRQAVNMLDSGLRAMREFPVNVQHMTVFDLGQGGRDTHHKLSPKLVPMYKSAAEEIPKRIRGIQYWLGEINKRLADKRKPLVEVTILHAEDYPDPDAQRTADSSFDLFA